MDSDIPVRKNSFQFSPNQRDYRQLPTDPDGFTKNGDSFPLRSASFRVNKLIGITTDQKGALPLAKSPSFLFGSGPAKLDTILKMKSTSKLSAFKREEMKKKMSRASMSSQSSADNDSTTTELEGSNELLLDLPESASSHVDNNFGILVDAEVDYEDIITPTHSSSQLHVRPLPAPLTQSPSITRPPSFISSKTKKHKLSTSSIEFYDLFGDNSNKDSLKQPLAVEIPTTTTTIHANSATGTTESPLLTLTLPNQKSRRNSNSSTSSNSSRSNAKSPVLSSASPYSPGHVLNETTTAASALSALSPLTPRSAPPTPPIRTASFRDNVAISIDFGDGDGIDDRTVDRSYGRYSSNTGTSKEGLFSISIPPSQ